MLKRRALALSLVIALFFFHWFRRWTAKSDRR